MTVSMKAIEWVPAPKPVKHAVGGGTSATDWGKIGEAADVLGEAAKALYDDSPADEVIDGVTGLGQQAVDGFLDSLGLGDEE